MGVAVFAEVEADTVVVVVVGLLMQGLQGWVADGHGIFQALFRLCHLITGDVFIVLDIGADGHVDGSLVSSHNTDVAVAQTDFAPYGLNGHATHEAHLALQPLMLGGDTVQIGT